MTARNPEGESLDAGAMPRPRPTVRKGHPIRTDRCARGHLYDGYIHYDGYRRCSQCLERNPLQAQARKRARAEARS